MAQGIPLLVTANQQLNVTLDSGEFTITLREAGSGIMAADIEIDGVTIVTGAPCLAGEPLIPYAYLQNGNLVFDTPDDEIPYWDKFDLSHFLFYLTDDEMA